MSEDTELRDVRLPFMVTRSEVEAIDEFRYAEKIPSRAEAMRQLMEMGLASWGGGRKKLRRRKGKS
jgi:hypothetical protein